MDSMESKKNTAVPSYNIPVILLCFSISIFLSSFLFLAYHLSNTNKGSIAIPAGKTYLGPPESQPSWTNFNQKETPTQPLIFTADDKTPWKIWTAQHHAYRFSYPQTLLLSDFPNDPSDAVGFAWNGKKAAENILINVIDLSANKTYELYVKKPKKEFVNAWWKQFSGLTGVSPIEQFTNKKGLKGYKARFINTKGETPNVDIFFEVPGNPALIIRIANGILDPALFDKMVDTVEWKSNK